MNYLTYSWALWVRSSTRHLGYIISVNSYNSLRGRYYYQPYLKNEETEAQKDEVTWLKSLANKLLHWDSNSVSVHWASLPGTGLSWTSPLSWYTSDPTPRFQVESLLCSHVDPVSCSTRMFSGITLQAVFQYPPHLANAPTGTASC